MDICCTLVREGGALRGVGTLVGTPTPQRHNFVQLVPLYPPPHNTDPHVVQQAGHAGEPAFVASLVPPPQSRLHVSCLEASGVAPAFLFSSLEEVGAFEAQLAAMHAESDAGGGVMPGLPIHIFSILENFAEEPAAGPAVEAPDSWEDLSAGGGKHAEGGGVAAEGHGGAGRCRQRWACAGVAAMRQRAAAVLQAAMGRARWLMARQAGGWTRGEIVPN